MGKHSSNTQPFLLNRKKIKLKNKKKQKKKGFLTVQLEADVLQAHPSEKHSLPLSIENDSTHTTHQCWVSYDSGAVLDHVVLVLQEVLQPFDGSSLGVTLLQQ